MEETTIVNWGYIHIYIYIGIMENQMETTRLDFSYLCSRIWHSRDAPKLGTAARFPRTAGAAGRKTLGWGAAGKPWG